MVELVFSLLYYDGRGGRTDGPGSGGGSAGGTDCFRREGAERSGMERRKEPEGSGPARPDGATLAYCRQLGQALERGFESDEEKGGWETCWPQGRRVEEGGRGVMVESQ